MLSGKGPRISTATTCIRRKSRCHGLQAQGDLWVAQAGQVRIQTPRITNLVGVWDETSGKASEDVVAPNTVRAPEVGA